MRCLPVCFHLPGAKANRRFLTFFLDVGIFIPEDSPIRRIRPPYATGNYLLEDRDL